MNKKAKKFILVGGVTLFVILALFVYFDFPIYPRPEQEVDSVQMLRDKLSEYEATSRLVVVVPHDYEGRRQSQSVLLSGRKRTAKPRGYWICWDVSLREGFDATVDVVGKIPDSDDYFDGESYRNGTVKLELFRDDTQCRVMALSLLWGEYIYTVDTAYDITGLSEQELAELEADLQALVYSVADRIIDAAG